MTFQEVVTMISRVIFHLLSKSYQKRRRNEING